MNIKIKIKYDADTDSIRVQAVGLAWYHHRVMKLLTSQTSFPHRRILSRWLAKPAMSRPKQSFVYLPRDLSLKIFSPAGSRFYSEDKAIYRFLLCRESLLRLFACVASPTRTSQSTCTVDVVSGNDNTDKQAVLYTFKVIEEELTWYLDYYLQLNRHFGTYSETIKQTIHICTDGDASTAEQKHSENLNRWEVS